MFQQFFASSRLLVFPLIALLLFFAVFTVVLLKVTIGMRDKDHLRRMARMPLDDSEDEPAAREISAAGKRPATAMTGRVS